MAAITDEARRLLKTGQRDAALVWAGQVQGLIHDILDLPRPGPAHHQRGRGDLSWPSREAWGVTCRR